MAVELDLEGLSENTVKMFLEKLGGALLSVVIYGSQVDGRAFGDSDVDILIISKDGVPYSRLEELCRAVNSELTLRYVNKVNCIPFNRSDVEYMLRMKNPFLISVFENNIVVYDPRGFFQRILAKIRELFKGNKLKIYRRSGLVFVR